MFLLGVGWGVGIWTPRHIWWSFTSVKVAEKFCCRKGAIASLSLLYVLSYHGPKGILYINPSDLGWNPPVSSWIDRREIQSERANLTILFDKYLPTCLDTLRTRYHWGLALLARARGHSCAVLHIAWMPGFLLAPESPEHHWFKLRETTSPGAP